MLEYPEVTARAEELRAHVAGKRVKAVLPPTKPHKFCWFNGEAADYEKKLAGSTLASAEGFGIFVELVFDNSVLAEMAHRAGTIRKRNGRAAK